MLRFQLHLRPLPYFEEGLWIKGRSETQPSSRLSEQEGRLADPDVRGSQEQGRSAVRSRIFCYLLPSGMPQLLYGQPCCGRLRRGKFWK